MSFEDNWQYIEALERTGDIWKKLLGKVACLDILWGGDIPTTKAGPVEGRREMSAL